MGPFEKIPDVVKPTPGKVTEVAGAVGYVVNQKHNDAVIAVNRLLKANEDVSFVADRSYQSNDGTGVIFIGAKPTTKAILDKAALDLGLNFTAVTARPAGMTYKLTKPRIGLWDMYGGSMPSGHVRWLLEQFEFDFERVFPQTLDAGNLKAKYDVLLFPDGGIPRPTAAAVASAADASRARTKCPRSSAASRPRHDQEHDSEAEGIRGSRRRDRRPSADRRCSVITWDCRSAITSSKCSRTAPSARFRARSSTCRDRSCRSPSTTPTRSPSASRRRSTCSSTAAR
jgi:hypothetical protein